MFIGEPPRAPEEGDPIPWVPDTDAPGLSDFELVADIWTADARVARHAAQRAEAITALARRRSIERDRDFGRLWCHVPEPDPPGHDEQAPPDPLND